MSAAAPLQTAQAKAQKANNGALFLQRKCACGSGASALTGECEECSKKKRLGLQTKLKINERGDIYEQEANRIADQVMATSANPAVSAAPPRIQRVAAQPTGRMETAPASVDRALASPGRPLEPTLRQDMEQRLGYDFSQVRVHTGLAAEQSARDVNAHAYTVGSNIVFGVGRFVPGTHEGRRLIAHELTHTIQQSSQAFTSDSRQLLGSRTPAALQRKTPIEVEPRTIPTREEIDKRAEPVKREMKEALKTWKEESRWGVQNFVNAELEAKIDEVRSSGVTASSFLVSLAGNIVWAAACFTTGGMAFGISLAGIAIAASVSLPGDKGLSDKGTIAAMAKEVQQYLDQCETWLKADVDRRAHNLVLFNQDKDQVELLELFMMNSFKPDVLAKGPEGRLTQLNPGAVREAQQRALTERWQHFKETVPLAGKQAGSEATATATSGIGPKGGRLGLILVQGTGTLPPRWGLGLELWPNKFGIAKWVPNDVLDDVDRRIQEVAGKKLPPLTAKPSQIVVYPDQFWQTVEGIWVAP